MLTQHNTTQVMEFGYQQSVQSLVSVFKANSCSLCSFPSHNYISGQSPCHCPGPAPQPFPNSGFRVQFSLLPRHEHIIAIELVMVDQAKIPCPTWHLGSLLFGGTGPCALCVASTSLWQAGRSSISLPKPLQSIYIHQQPPAVRLSLQHTSDLHQPHFRQCLLSPLEIPPGPPSTETGQGSASPSELHSANHLSSPR